MLKAVGALCLLAACTGIGFRIASFYRRRPLQITALMDAFRLLQADVEYSLAPLPEALNRVATRVAKPWSPLFQTAGTVLQQPGHTVEQAFARGLDICRSQVALQAVDLAVIEQISEGLATTDRAHLSVQFEVGLERLKHLAADAEEARRKNERLWQYLGILGGLLLVILLY